jgi:hypothetical protein
MGRKTATAFRVEGLEDRSLLSAISYSLTTDQPTYQVGQAIQFTFTETNTSDQPVSVSVEPTNFTVSNGVGAIWQSNPAAVGQAASLEELQPGQSVTQTASWDGTIPDTPPSFGSTPPTYALNEWGAFQVSNLNAPPGTSAAFQIADPIEVQVTTDQQAYQLGQPVLMTATETNTASQAVTFFDSGPTALTVWHDGAEILHAVYPLIVTAGPTTWAAGKTVTQTQTWNGVPDSGLVNTTNFWGEFSAAFGPEDNPTEYTQPFVIAPPSSWDVASSISTDRSVYEVGQPVTMTFTETNEGTAPIPIIAGPPSFSITQGGRPYWQSLPSSSPEVWVTLQPGQSLTQTETWNPQAWESSVGATGTFAVTDWLDPDGSLSTFQIVAPSGANPPTGVPNTSGGNSSTQGPGATGLMAIGIVAPETGSSSQVPATPLVSSTASTNRSTYRPGQDVRIIMSINGGSTNQTALPTARRRELITIVRGSTVVWKATRRVPSVALKRAEAGVTAKVSKLWDGRPNQADIRSLKAGEYTIDVTYGDYGGSTTIRIGRKRS